MSFPILFSCTGNDSGNILLATVEDEKLYWSDLYIPEQLHGKDSIDFIQNSVDKWIYRQIIYAEAMEELSEEEKNIDKELEKIKQQLIIRKYEEKLLSDTTNSSVSEADALSYYRNNPEEFMLKENIVRVKYVKVPNNSEYLNDFRILIRSNEASDYSKLLKLSEKHALNSFFNDEVWLYFNDLLKEVPIKTYNQVEFLNRNNFIELEKDSTMCFLYIRDFMIHDSRSPFPLVKEKIKAILQAQKNQILLKESRNKIYKKALSEKKINVFYKN